MTAINNSHTSLDSLISLATKQNWHRLGIFHTHDLNKNATNHTQRTTQKLTTRANKKLSTKNIIPTEYFCNTKNIPQIQHIAQYISAKKYPIQNAIFSLALNLLRAKNLLHKPHIKSTLQEYDWTPCDDLLDFALPCDEIDVLGLLYQCLLCEGEKNIMGAYYTPHAITKAMTQNLDFSKGQILLDPACGSGAFLLRLENANPSQIFGIDNDPIAVFIAKINLLVKFSDLEFIPQIYCADYLEFSTKSLFENKIQNPLQNTHFDYIITNPPWGVCKANKKAKSYTNDYVAHITSGERFSLFFVKSYEYLKPNGIMKFLLPKSMLNVKAHRDLRSFILGNGVLQEIRHYANIFSGVSTEFVSVEHKKLHKILESRAKSHIKLNLTTKCKIIKNNQMLEVPLSAFHISQNLNFSALTKQDLAIIEKVKAQGKFDLSQSIWALGIVTGDNKNALHKEHILGSEAIYTGKEIIPYRLQKTRNFIVYDRVKFQQVAKDEIYRAKEKLVYKFISNKLAFAYDSSGALFLNSANILIPRIPNMSIKTALGFLNSELFAYLHQNLFGEIKILRGNLEQLPFPQITHSQDKKIASLVGKIIDGDNVCEVELQAKIYEIFGITDREQIYIKGVLNGKT